MPVLTLSGLSGDPFLGDTSWEIKLESTACPPYHGAADCQNVTLQRLSMTTTEQSNAMQCVYCTAVFKTTSQRCSAFALEGKRTCARHGALSTGPKTPEGRQRCAQARTTHGQQTTSMRIERSLASARLAVLEEIGHSINMMTGSRTRGRKPDRMGEVYPELQALYQKLVIERAKHGA